MYSLRETFDYVKYHQNYVYQKKKICIAKKLTYKQLKGEKNNKIFVINRRITFQRKKNKSYKIKFCKIEFT